MIWFVGDIVLVLQSDTGEEGCETSKVFTEEEGQLKFGGAYDISDEGKLFRGGGERSVGMD